MANYTAIPTGEEQGLASDTIKSESTKKDTNVYLKLACVGLLCVVAFMSGSVRSRNTVASMVNSAVGGDCQTISSIRAGGFAGYDECVQQGDGNYGCLHPEEADEYVNLLTEQSQDLFPNGWQKKSCAEQGYDSPLRTFDFGSYIPQALRYLIVSAYGQNTLWVTFMKA